jgi:hypothetical protein
MAQAPHESAPASGRGAGRRREGSSETAGPTQTRAASPGAPLPASGLELLPPQPPEQVVPEVPAGPLPPPPVSVEPAVTVEPPVPVAPLAPVEPAVPVDPPPPDPATGKSWFASRVPLLPAQPPPWQVPPEPPAAASRSPFPLLETRAQPAVRTEDKRRTPTIQAGASKRPAGRKRHPASRGFGSCSAVRCIPEFWHTRPGFAFRCGPFWDSEKGDRGGRAHPWGDRRSPLPDPKRDARSTRTAVGATCGRLVQDVGSVATAAVAAAGRSWTLADRRSTAPCWWRPRFARSDRGTFLADTA